MNLQDWFDDNLPDEKLRYGNGMISQAIWMRDTLSIPRPMPEKCQ